MFLSSTKKQRLFKEYFLPPPGSSRSASLSGEYHFPRVRREGVAAEARECFSADEPPHFHRFGGGHERPSSIGTMPPKSISPVTRRACAGGQRQSAFTPFHRSILEGYHSEFWGVEEGTRRISQIFPISVKHFSKDFYIFLTTNFGPVAERSALHLAPCTRHARNRTQLSQTQGKASSGSYRRIPKRRF